MSGLIGTCQQLEDASGSSGDGPTGVSIATGASGNYNNSFVVDNRPPNNGSSYDLNGSDLDPDVVLSLEGNDGPYKMDWGNVPASEAEVFAYLRATDATSYEMQGSIAASSLSNGCSVLWSGSAFSSQDGTGSNGIGYFILSHGGGRGGYFVPADGDWIRVKVEGTATAVGGGTTDATDVVMKINFVDA
tara:strand:- start:1232 stop:1798 length:567 start_codon:yes stop_codon:yes gene_type:complete